ncbi:hypothetical protein SAMD00019534_021140 [Acytostelium subglobosum LB1]|uniref:hypothetical protein n=1 Tax=Acytostelium subglobosum LB1 TaxID=1410327 RepID=UPI000644EBBF|nr:hypothetical protein SAMD00019534_021140 [Acytostelium subglobosum LB1]GAM18939.1 hypothetical protein SAMD00019534_021140 [Acytostelium subglobosum LB1]|eukprot:XP_012758159.1 hypothetical protein SAMD00019534_021140 [Acytostelium subglobosum LB1]
MPDQYNRDWFALGDQQTLDAYYDNTTYQLVLNYYSYDQGYCGSGMIGTTIYMKCGRENAYISDTNLNDCNFTLTFTSPAACAYPAPILTSIILTGGDSFEINGSGFGNNVQDINLYDSLGNSYSDFTLENGVLVVTNFHQPDALISLCVTVTGVNGSSACSNELELRFPISLNQLYGSPPTSGGNVTITGSNLVISADTAVNFAFVGSNIQAILNQSAWVIGIPSGSGTGLTLSLTIGGQVTNNLFVSYQPPTITSFQQSTDGSLTAEICGQNFGPTVDQMQVFIGSSQVQYNIEYTGCVMASIPSGALNGAAVSVMVGGQGAKYSGDIKLIPLVTSVTPIPRGGGTITIQGSLMSTIDANGQQLDFSVQLSPGNYACTNLVSIDENTMTCTAVDLADYITSVSLTIDGQTSPSCLIQVSTPTISSISATGTNSILISGSGFSQYVSNIQIIVDGVQQTDITITLDNNGNIIASNFPASSSISSLCVISDASTCSNSVDVQFAPVLTAITSADTSGSQVTVSGSNLYVSSYSGSISQVLNLDSTQLSPSNVISSTSWVFDIPPGTGAGHSVTVTINGMTSNQITLTYQSPVITDYLQNGTAILIEGNNFAPSGPSSLTKLYVGGLSATIVDSRHNWVMALLPPTARNGQMMLSVDGLSVNSTLVLEPTVQTVSSVPTHGGTITLMGTFLNIVDQKGAKLDVSIVLLPWVVDCNRISTLPPSNGYTYISCHSPDSGTNLFTSLNLTINGFMATAPVTSFVGGFASTLLPSMAFAITLVLLVLSIIV